MSLGVNIEKYNVIQTVILSNGYDDFDFLNFSLKKFSFYIYQWKSYQNCSFFT